MNGSTAARALLVAGVIGLGLSGGLVTAAMLPGGSVPSAVAQIWDGAVGRVVQHGGVVRSDYFAAAAAYIGITEAQLRSELGADKSLADVAIAHGKTRDALIQALAAAQQQSIAALVDQKGIGAKPQPGLRIGHGADVIGDSLAIAATYLGTTTADLGTKLRAGQTLAQIANATPGKNRDGLVAALVADAQAKIAAAQTSGRISAEQAAQLTSGLQARIAALVDSARTFGPRPRRIP